MEPNNPVCPLCESVHDKSYSPPQASDDSNCYEAICELCCQSLKDEEDVIVHELCQRTFHVSCLDSWSCAQEEADPSVVLSCPACERHVSALQPTAIRFVAATEHTPQRLEALLHVGVRVYYQNPVHAYYRAHALAVRTGNSVPLNLVQRFFGCEVHDPPCLCSLRKQDVENDSSVGSALWQKTTTIYGGALEVKHCDHNIECILITAEQMHRFLPYLWLQGWDPSYGRLIPRVIAERGISLNQLIEQAKRLNVSQVIIPYVQIGYLFPDLFEIDDGTALTIALKREVNENGSHQYWIEAIAFLKEAGRYARATSHRVVQAWIETFQMIYRLDPNFKNIISRGQDVSRLEKLAMSQTLAYNDILFSLDYKNEVPDLNRDDVPDGQT